MTAIGSKSVIAIFELRHVDGQINFKPGSVVDVILLTETTIDEIAHHLTLAKPESVTNNLLSQAALRLRPDQPTKPINPATICHLVLQGNIDTENADKIVAKQSEVSWNEHSKDKHQAKSYSIFKTA